MRGRLVRIVVFVLAVAAVIQLVPYGRDHANPAVRIEPAWDSERTRSLAVRACFDCHSNQTVWPWYSNIAPISWLARRDVDAGRRKVNFSEWDRRQKEARESAKTVAEGEMPPWYYTIMGASRRLSSVEKRDLARGLAATLGSRN
jgi:cytochrome c551/c552